MSYDDTTISEAELARLLPTCQRCRRLRRKCDTQLPACRLCQKGKAECTFFDHALQQSLPRSYVHSLMIRLGRLKSVQAALSGSESNLPPLAVPQNDGSIAPVDPAIQDWGSGTLITDVSFDKHFIIANANPTCWQFFGSSSAYSLAVEVLVHATARFGPLTHQENYAGTDFWLSAQAKQDQDFTKSRGPPSRSDVEMLLNFYLSTTNILVAYVDFDTLSQDIDIYMSYAGTDARALTGKTSHQFFRVAMACAIAASNKARHQHRFAAESMQYYSEALQCVEEVTSDISADALVALLLLINFSIFYPRKGDVWKLLDFACRLSVELNYHTEPNNPFEDEKSRTRRRAIFWGLYCVERTLGQQFGRPSDLPEEIITAEYPATLTTLALADPNSFQSALISHAYRLAYIRSEIFRQLYVPAKTPHLSRLWYEQQLQNVLEWRREFQFLDHVVGMGSMTCDVGFESTICFLFQPLLLRALATTKDPGGILAFPMDSNDNTFNVDVTSSQTTIPLESYHSACKIIEFYKKVFRSSEASPYGTYPVTLLSAHYIHNAVMTIMAHCLLAIDGRLPVSFFSQEFFGAAPADNNTTTTTAAAAAAAPSMSPGGTTTSFMSTNLSPHTNPHPNMNANANTTPISASANATEPPFSTQSASRIDFSNIHEVSGSCLIVLSKLVERFPGMIGMLDIYQNLSDKVLPVMIRSGLG